MVNDLDKEIEEKNEKENAVLAMIGTMADTTWRMFVPIIGLLLVGIFLDKTFSLFPWLTIVGLLLGIALSSVLVSRLLKKGSK